MITPEWKRPRTQKVYLQPPLAERIVMLWPDFKITNYSFSDNGRHIDQETTGFVLLHDRVDFRFTSYRQVRGGMPVHQVQADVGYELSMEAFCSMDRNPNVYCKIRAYNPHAFAVDDSFAILARTGPDRYLSNSAETGYASYNPNPGTFLFLKNNWTEENQLATDGKGFLRIDSTANMHIVWLQKEGVTDKFAADRCYQMHYHLEPGEECCAYISFRYGEAPCEAEYEAAKAETERAWRKIFDAIKLIPDTDNPVYQNVFFALATQAMQMLARYKEHDWVIPRQGDVGCFVWPWEAAHLLNALDRIGLSQYTADAYRYFVQRWIRQGGEEDGKVECSHQQWDNLNGSLIWGISQHLLYVQNAEEFAFFRPHLNRCLAWIEKKRHELLDDADAKYEGLFQPGKGSDFDDIARHWIFTDATNVRGIRTMAAAYKMYSAQEYAYVQSVYEDYQAAMERVLGEMYNGHEQDEMFLIPHNLGVPFEDTETQCYSINSIKCTRSGDCAGCYERFPPSFHHRL